MSKTTASVRFGSDFALQEDNNGAAKCEIKENQTIRLNLELFPTDSCSYPEFNYSKLIHLKKKKMKKLKQKSNGDLGGAVEDDVARIAKEMEEKYGTSYISGRSRRKRDDQCDIGLGYDESDSFIDNTEAYDEVIPEEVETIEGGFYINCGALEFKKLHTESTTTKTDEIIKMPNRPKKRVLSTSSEDSSTSEDEDDDDSESEAEESDTDSDATITPQNSKSNKPSSSGSGSNNGNVPNEKRPKKITKKSQENGKKNGKGSIAISCSSSNSPRPTADEQGSDSEKERIRQQKTVKTTTVKDMLKAKRDSFLKLQTGNGTATVTDTKTANGGLKGSPTVISDDSSSGDSAEDSEGDNAESDSNESAGAVQRQKDKKAKKTTNSSSNTNNEDNTEKLRSSDTKLPELEAEIVTSITQFKETVKTKNMTGKKFQFDDNLTEVFLRIDESLLCIEKAQRNMVFAHLEYHLLLPKYFFLRKAKQLRIKEEKLKSKRSLGKLRKAVIETMPGAIASYEIELRKCAEQQEANSSAEHPAKMPKKKFPWNNNLRNLLYEVYQVRWTSYPVLGTRKETLEDFINVYLREKVVEIWPNGWMRYEELQKEIEKSKAATKRAKEKKAKTKPATTKASSIPATSMQQNVTSTSTDVVISTVSSNSYIKQFEEFATISAVSVVGANNNSDTESVASSSASTSNSGLKRKNTENSKHGRNKTLKSNKGIATVTATRAAESQQSLFELLSPTKRVESNMAVFSTAPTSTTSLATLTTAHVLSANSAHQTSATTSSIFSAIPSAIQLQKHSSLMNNEKLLNLAPNIRVIDLDQFKCASDILKTSKQFMNSTPAAGAKEATMTNVERLDSSSESDGVEIVGIFPAKAGSINTQKYTNKTTNSFNVDAMNNNNGFDVVNAVKVLKELGEMNQLPTTTSIPITQNASAKDNKSQ